MPSSRSPSAADQQLIDHAARHGLRVTAKQLAGWRRAGLLPGNVTRGLGRGRGSASSPPPESFELVLALARRAGRGKRPTDLALLLFGEGLRVPEKTVRAAFKAAVDTIVLPGEEDISDDDLDLDGRLDHINSRLAKADLTMTLVPARARRIDERIAEALGEAPAALLELDKAAEPCRLTAQDAMLTAVAATLGDTIPLQDIARLMRTLHPSMAAHPIASLIETTRQDVPNVAHRVLAEDESLTFLPNGDVRKSLQDVADTASLEDLAAGWRTAQQVREWALDLCTQVERELDTEQLGKAVMEWLRGRYLQSGLSVLETLRERRWSPTSGALSALLSLFELQMLAKLDNLGSRLPVAHPEDPRGSATARA